MLDECQGLYMCVVCLLIALYIDKYVFGDNDAMLYAQMLASVCVSIDTSVEHVFNEVKT